MISIVTPWHNSGKLIPTYKRSTAGAELVIVDNASGAETGAALHELAIESGGAYLYNKKNRPFGVANNQGYALTSCDIILFMNNDIEAPPGLVQAVEDDVEQDGVLYGPKLQTRYIAGRKLDYLEGFCIAATRATWNRLGGWVEWPGNYWEDNELCLRAERAGMRLQQTDWQVWHYGNYTASRTPGAYAHSSDNHERLVEAVRKGK